MGDHTRRAGRGTWSAAAPFAVRPIAISAPVFAAGRWIDSPVASPWLGLVLRRPPSSRASS